MAINEISFFGTVQKEPIPGSGVPDPLLRPANSACKSLQGNATTLKSTFKGGLSVIKTSCNPLVGNFFSSEFVDFKGSLLAESDVELTTTQADANRDLEKSTSQKIVGNALFSTGGFFGLNLAACRGKNYKVRANKQARKIEYFIALDRSSRTRKLWEQVIPIVLNEENFMEAQQKIKKLLKEKAADFWSHSDQITSQDRADLAVLKLDWEIERKRSWLHSQSYYHTVRKIIRSGKFLFLGLDMLDSTCMDGVAEKIKKLGLTIDTYYFSNMRQRAEEENRREDYLSSVESLGVCSLSKSLVIEKMSRLLLKKTNFEIVDNLVKFY